MKLVFFYLAHDLLRIFLIGEKVLWHRSIIVMGLIDHISSQNEAINLSPVNPEKNISVSRQMNFRANRTLSNFE